MASTGGGDHGGKRINSGRKTIFEKYRDEKGYSRMRIRDSVPKMSNMLKGPQIINILNKVEVWKKLKYILYKSESLFCRLQCQLLSRPTHTPTGACERAATGGRARTRLPFQTSYFVN